MILVLRTMSLVSTEVMFKYILGLLVEIPTDRTFEQFVFFDYEIKSGEGRMDRW